MENATNFYNFSSNLSNNASPLDPTTTCRDDVIQEKIIYLCFILKGVIIPLGILCCMLSFAVFVTSKALKRTSTGNFLLALSIADWLFLCGELLRWLNTYSFCDEFYLGLNFMFTNNIICKLAHFVRYGSKLASAWITVAITA